MPFCFHLLFHYIFFEEGLVFYQSIFELLEEGKESEMAVLQYSPAEPFHLGKRATACVFFGRRKLTGEQ